MIKKIVAMATITSLVMASLLVGRDKPKQTNEPQPLVIIRPDYTDDYQFQKALE